eukprot:TRINITY_DN9460_c0_g7_i2.p3 TRINITY_DN9460_c0_g7~~TRINITY_DN9460_c0_g7_i2.p3  ORF type:complete len:107 (+),score=27.10 TRINITY_DN9460_c0_g7_i2:1183-1503(+)
MKEQLMKEREGLQKQVDERKALCGQEALAKSRARSIERRLKTPIIGGYEFTRGNGRRNEKSLERIGQTRDIWGRNSDAEKTRMKEAMNTQNFIRRQIQANVTNSKM